MIPEGVSRRIAREAFAERCPNVVPQRPIRPGRPITGRTRNGRLQAMSVRMRYSGPSGSRSWAGPDCRPERSRTQTPFRNHAYPAAQLFSGRAPRQSVRRISETPTADPKRGLPLFCPE